MINKFNCEKCGACCRKGGYVIPEFNSNNTGICKYLENNLCRIYNTRPFICRVDKIYDRCFVNIMTREEFHRITKLYCNLLREGEKSCHGLL